MQNLGLATVIIFAGMIVDKYGYLMLEMFFLGCLFGKIQNHKKKLFVLNEIEFSIKYLFFLVSLIAAVLIYIIDSANNGVLNMSPSMRDSTKT